MYLENQKEKERVKLAKATFTLQSKKEKIKDVKPYVVSRATFEGKTKFDLRK